MFVMSRKSDNDRRSNDSAGQYGKVFSVAVVGLSGTEKDKGCLGVGKSCLCNRFVRPHADDYNRDHISVLSQTDFSGPIVNNEHWLYWGETRKCTEEGFELTFSVVEQTEFVDDACFQPFRSGKMEPYFRRCAATKLSSAEKLMYVCKNQLGVEKEYTQHYLADGRFNVDGFICVFDVSEGEDRDISRQVDLTALILSTLLKTKKPVVMVTTKNDEVCPAFMREAEKLVNRREFKGMIPLIETSAHDNINVDLAFWACVQRDWPKGKTKILSYQDSYQRQCDRRDMVSDNYLSLIRSHITDYRTHWKNTYSNLSQSQDFLVFCDLFGQEKAQQTFKRHVRMLRDDYVCRKMQKFLRILPEAFAQMLPNLESFGPDRTWPAVQQIIQNHSLFNEHFVVNEGLSWQDMDDSNESRIPFDLLLTPEAEKAFVNHLDGLLQEEHLRNLRHQFSELLRETPILPGQSLKNVRLHLSERECVQLLPESELGFIYEDYQRLLQERAREQFYELLLERAPFFMQYNTGKMVTQEDFAEISEKLMDDERWIAIDLLPQDRELALIRHLGFIQWPIKEHCLSYHACVDINSEVFCSSLAKPSRHHMWNSESEKIRVKLTIFGTMQLAENLASVIRAMQSWLEENSRISLDIHISSGNDNIGLLESRHYLNSLEPEAYFCIYSNRTTLEMVRKCLEQSLLTDLQFGNPHHANSASVCLPLTLLLAADSEVSSKERSYLREESQNRAQSLQCAFFDVTSDDRHTHFKSDELRRVLTYLTESVTRRSELMHVYNPASLNSIIPEGALNPEVRILLCMMCGDPILPAQFLELLLLPNTAFYPLTKNSIVTDVGYLAALDQATNGNELDLHDVPSRYVEFVISSYHGAFSQKDERLHGYILVYWSKRQASFSNMSAVVSNINTHPIVPINILALVENESRPSKLSHQLVAEGQELADSLNVNFRVSTLSHHLGRCISSFLNQLLENKHEIDESLQMAPTFIQSLAQHTSPNSTISSSNLNECYDPNLESHLGPMTVPPVSHSLHGQLPHDSVPDEALHDNIYEHLPNEHVSIPHEPNKAVPSVYERGGLPSPLVKQSRANNLRAQQQHMHSFGSGIIEPPDIASEHEPSSYFTTAYSRDSEEQLLKPSQIRQRSRRLNPDGRLINAAADKYALSSGWAYHQTANAASSRHHLSDQWLPPQNITDEDSNSLERAKAPGKLDLKRFSNLSDAIGRLNLNSPSHPLGPTRASGHSFDESEYGARNFFEKATDQFDNLKHPKRGGRTKTKQNKDVDPSDKKQVLKSKSVGTFSELDSNNKKLSRKADKLEKKRQKEEERKCRKASKETESRNRSRSKGIVVDQAGASPSTSALETFAQSNGNLVPLFIEKCTQFIEQEGLDMEGIYRVPGNRANVDTLLLQFDENPHINISELDIPVNAVATALKDFFMKRLPPIFPSDCMDDIANLSRQYSCSGGALAEIRTFLLQLPTANYRIIHFMIGHFVKVVQKSAINSMDSKNLAICWWPTLLQFEFSDMFVFEQMRPHLMDFVQILIDSYDELFIANCAKVNSSDELTNQSCSADELVSL